MRFLINEWISSSILFFENQFIALGKSGMGKQNHQLFCFWKASTPHLKYYASKWHVVATQLIRRFYPLIILDAMYSFSNCSHFLIMNFIDFCYEKILRFENLYFQMLISKRVNIKSSCFRSRLRSLVA